MRQAYETPTAVEVVESIEREIVAAGQRDARCRSADAVPLGRSA